MLVWVELKGRRVRQTPRAAHKLVVSHVGRIIEPGSKEAYEEWLKSQKPASTVPAPEKPTKAVKRTRKPDAA